jgi:hypothetical protein
VQSNINAIQIGGTGGGSYITGIVDEVRIAHTQRSADWILTEYNNQELQGTTITVGNEEQPLVVSEGKLQSSVFNVGQPSNWLQAVIDANIPAGTSVGLKIRTSNSLANIVSVDFEDCLFINDLTNISANGCLISGHSYFQYELTLGRTNNSSPTVNSIRIIYDAVDTTAPEGVISINGGAQYTSTKSVGLVIDATDDRVGNIEMQVSESSNFTGASWQLLNDIAFELSSGDGIKTVYVKFRDLAGNESVSYSDTIILDTTTPTGSVVINNGDGQTIANTVTLTLNTNDSGSGVAYMYITTNPNDEPNSLDNFVEYQNSVHYQLSSGLGERFVYVIFMDGAGNQSTKYSASIQVIQEEEDEGGGNNEQQQLMLFRRSRGDFNNDGVVNIFDLSILAESWQATNPVADANGDGVVNIFDLSILAVNWLTNPNP